MLEKILVISPHPDDETLGAGGTLLRFKQTGAKIFWLNITDMLEEYGYKNEEIVTWDATINAVAAQYQVEKFFNLRLKPAGLDVFPRSQLVEKISQVFREVEPDTIILPFENDVHTDHKIVFEAVLACTKTFRFPFIKRVMAMEILSETDYAVFNQAFSPNVWIDITPFMEKKLEIVNLYKTEISSHPFPRSETNIRSLALLRGSQSDVTYAESFLLIKEIISQ
ncbi:MAG: PIG-L family deacetylase [Candidatus Margulisbacteria bacterium]|nr:PIG-L family deacetylase [Candidatus Margulisiibacteriota bacterium]